MVLLSSVNSADERRMSMKNCLYDKALHATKEECHCSPPFYRDDGHVHSSLHFQSHSVSSKMGLNLKMGSEN